MDHANADCLITGANRGIGFEFARQYLADGWQVYAACRDPTSASELRQLAEDSGERLRILAMDVTDARSVKAAAEVAGEPIDRAERRVLPRCLFDVVDVAFHSFLAVVLHLVAVVVTEIHEGGSITSAMLTGRKILTRKPPDAP